ncbi:MAG: LLM class flavin-dependent oxidoreductase, partial [Comamonas sp.]
MTRPRLIELNAWINASGDAEDSWLLPGRDPGRIFTLAHYVEAARIAHRGVFGNVFTSDRPQLVIDAHTRPEHTLDPVALFSALLAQVPDIGAIVTASTTYSDPYTLARQIQSLNLLSGGRAAWNVVTSWNPAIAANFSDQALPDRAARYARAEEFIEVVLKLWDSWQFPWGAPASELVVPGRVRPIDHRGTHFSVAGPLNVPQAPGGRPRLLQAGGSPAGIRLAARFADDVYAPPGSLAGARALRQELHAAARALGRPEDRLPRLIPVLVPILCASEAEAAALRQAHAEAAPVTEAELDALAALLGVERARTAADRPLRPEDFGDVSASVVPIGAIRAKRALALDEGLSLSGLVRR